MEPNSASVRLYLVALIRGVEAIDFNNAELDRDASIELDATTEVRSALSMLVHGDLLRTTFHHTDGAYKTTVVLYRKPTMLSRARPDSYIAAGVVVENGVVGGFEIRQALGELVDKMQEIGIASQGFAAELPEIASRVRSELDTLNRFEKIERLRRSFEPLARRRAPKSELAEYGFILRRLDGMAMEPAATLSLLQSHRSNILSRTQILCTVLKDESALADAAGERGWVLQDWGSLLGGASASSNTREAVTQGARALPSVDVDSNRPSLGVGESGPTLPVLAKELVLLGGITARLKAEIDHVESRGKANADALSLLISRIDSATSSQVQAGSLEPGTQNVGGAVTFGKVPFLSPLTLGRLVTLMLLLNCLVLVVSLYVQLNGVPSRTLKISEQVSAPKDVLQTTEPPARAASETVAAVGASIPASWPDKKDSVTELPEQGLIQDCEGGICLWFDRKFALTGNSGYALEEKVKRAGWKDIVVRPLLSEPYADEVRGNAFLWSKRLAAVLAVGGRRVEFTDVAVDPRLRDVQPYAVGVLLVSKGKPLPDTRAHAAPRVGSTDNDEATRMLLEETVARHRAECGSAKENQNCEKKRADSK